MQSITTLEQNLIEARSLYDDGKSTKYTDEEYDEMFETLRQVNPSSDFFNTFGEKHGEDITLEIPMGSLDQLRSDEQITKFIRDPHAEFIVSEKLDGISLQLTYENRQLVSAQRRGNGLIGTNVSRLASFIKDIPQKLHMFMPVDRIILRGELIFPKYASHLWNSEFTNARSYVAGKSNAHDWPAEFLSNAHFVVFGIDSGFDDLEKSIAMKTIGQCFRIVESYDVNQPYLTVDRLNNALDARRKYSDYEIDGLVIEHAETKYRDHDFDKGLNPSYAFKFKTNDPNKYRSSTVVAVHWAASKDRYLKPRVEIEPVNVDGVTISFATGFNAKFICDNGIGPGAKLEIVRSGDVIPHILRVTEKVEPSMPTEIWQWNESNVDAVLLEDNDESKRARLHFFLGTLGVKGLGTTSFNNLYAIFNDWFTFVKDLTVVDMMEATTPNQGMKLFSATTAAIESLTLAQWMKASQILGRGFGAGKMSKIEDHFGLDLQDIDLDTVDLVQVSGISAHAAESLVEGLKDMKSMLETLQIKPPRRSFAPAALTQELAGQQFCFTGVRDKDLEKRIIEAGGEIKSGVSAKVTHLICKDPNGSSSKLKAARAKGLTILSLEEAQSIA